MTTDRFLSRWARRKAAARHAEAAPPEPPAPVKAPEVAPPVAQPNPAEAATALSRAAQVPEPELPPLDSLQGLVSEYRGFMSAGVDPNVKRAALKKLFSDPHFNVMDGLDVYIDDYGIPDPIPATMLASLHQARTLLFNEPEVESTDAVTEEESAPTAIAQADESIGEPPAVASQTESDVLAADDVEDAPDPATPANEPPLTDGQKDGGN